MRSTTLVAGPSGSGRGVREAGRRVVSIVTALRISSLAEVIRGAQVLILGEVGILFDQVIARLIDPRGGTFLDRQVHGGQRLRPNLRLPHRRAGLGQLRREPRPAEERRGGLARDLGMERHRRLGLAQRLGVGSVPRPVGQALADPEHQLGQLHPLVAELFFLADLFEHLAGRFEGRRPGRAVGRDVLPDVGQRPNDPGLADSLVLGIARHESVEVANRGAIIAVLELLDSAGERPVGERDGDDRFQPDPHPDQDHQRQDQADDQRRGDDPLAAGCRFILGDPSPQNPPQPARGTRIAPGLSWPTSRAGLPFRPLRPGSRCSSNNSTGGAISRFERDDRLP